MCVCVCARARALQISKLYTRTHAFTHAHARKRAHARVPMTIDSLCVCGAKHAKMRRSPSHVHALEPSRQRVVNAVQRGENRTGRIPREGIGVRPRPDAALGGRKQCGRIRHKPPSARDANMCVRVCVHTRARACVCVRVCAYACLCVCARAQTCLPVNAHKHLRAANCAATTCAMRRCRMPATAAEPLRVGLGVSGAAAPTGAATGTVGATTHATRAVAAST